MLVVSFITQPVTNGYQIIDTSTDNSNASGKFIVLNDINGTQFFISETIPYTQQVYTIDTTNWTLLQKTAVNVTLEYTLPAGTSEFLQQGYLLPTTLNIQE